MLHNINKTNNMIHNLSVNNIILFKNDLHIITKINNNTLTHHHLYTIRKLERNNDLVFKYVLKDVFDMAKDEHLLGSYPVQVYKNYSENIDKKSKSKIITHDEIINMTVVLTEELDEYYKLDELNYSVPQGWSYCPLRPNANYLEDIHIQDNKIYYKNKYQLEFINKLKWTQIISNCSRVQKYHNQWRQQQISKLVLMCDVFCFNVLSPDEKDIYIKLKSEVCQTLIKVTEECPICLENNNNVYQGYYKCSHCVCDGCYKLCQTQTCCLCRSS